MHITGFKTYMQRVDDRPRLLLKIETSEGISGWGECYNHGPDWALPPLFDYLFHQIEGEDPRRVEFLVLKLNQQCRFPPGALGLAAISAIDHALWDIAGKAAGLPVYMLLGGHVRDRVRVYCGVYTAPDPQYALEQTLKLNEDYGYTAFKLSPYRRDLHNSRWGELVKETGDYFGKIREITPRISNSPSMRMRRSTNLTRPSSWLPRSHHTIRSSTKSRFGLNIFPHGQS